MTDERHLLPLADLRVTADGLAPEMGGFRKGCYLLLIVLLALLVTLAFAFYL